MELDGLDWIRWVSQSGMNKVQREHGANKKCRERALLESKSSIGLIEASHHVFATSGIFSGA